MKPATIARRIDDAMHRRGLTPVAVAEDGSKVWGFCPSCGASSMTSDVDVGPWCGTIGAGGTCASSSILFAAEAAPSQPAESTANARYRDRGIDLQAELAKPPQATPWRIDGLVADGTLTVVSGASGDGKTWIVYAAAVGVAYGINVGPFRTRQGNVLVVDAEMGKDLIVNRFRDTVGMVDGIFPYDAMGLDLAAPHDVAWLESLVAEHDARLIVIDSLRATSPNSAESDSNDMTPYMSGLRLVARRTGCAILLVHHAGDGSKWFRGSSAIKDHCDALFGVLNPHAPRREGDDDSSDADDDGVRRLSCRGRWGKMRYAPAPDDFWLRIAPRDGQMIEDAEPVEAARRGPTRPSATQRFTASILDAAGSGETFSSQKALAAACGDEKLAQNQSWRTAVNALVTAGTLVKAKDGLRLNATVLRPGGAASPSAPQPFEYSRPETGSA